MPSDRPPLVKVGGRKFMPWNGESLLPLDCTQLLELLSESKTFRRALHPDLVDHAGCRAYVLADPEAVPSDNDEIGGTARGYSSTVGDLAGTARDIYIRVELGGGGAGAGSAVGSSPPSPPRPTFRSLLVAGGVSVDEAVFQRVILRFALEASLACRESSVDTAGWIYRRAAALPSTATGNQFASFGITVVNGALVEGTDLTICHRGDRQFVLKALTEQEMDRARNFLSALNGRALPHVCPFELFPPSSPAARFMMMPRFLDVLERCPLLGVSATLGLWQQMRAALSSIHALGFAHMDVKPANICHRETGDFILADLGSLSAFGDRTYTTVSYLPRELIDQSSTLVSAQEVDWWMLALTLARKCCSPALDVGGAQAHTKAEIRVHLGAHLAAAVWEELSALLE